MYIDICRVHIQNPALTQTMLLSEWVSGVSKPFSLFVLGAIREGYR